MNEQQFSNIDGRFNLHYLATDKFKTNLVQIYFMLPLRTEKEAAMNALIPAILRRGSENYPDNQLIKTELENLYGSAINFNILKRGENQLLRFSLEMVNEKFLSHRSDLTKKAFQLLNDLIFRPVLENNKFKQKYFEQEKEVLKNNIEALINDKYSYTIENCIKKMCSREKYGIYKLGSIEELAKIENEELFAHYKKIIKQAKMSLFLVGNFKRKFIDDIFEQSLLPASSEIVDDNTELLYREKEAEYYQTELKLNQARLSMGYRTGITRNSTAYYALLVFNSLLGGSTHSKLFQEVREKRSLAYYVSSSIETTKGLLFINSGINSANSKKVENLTQEQLAKIAAGDFSEEEFSRSKKSIINSLKQDLDSNKALAAHFLLSLINNKEESINATIKQVEQIKRSDLIKVAKKLRLDTIYLLKGKDD
ncbi:EF-P 5-aminopentanol modification-associated protein YfmF [Halanaerobium salsuginis]|jgi:predicted Zn-dependent peptidase|uniref:Predicted Zn-dependent peptidase n=1 Tax=Halanaerobium salsuginis TaxID=29563 RepID=A0A1I4EQJ3_9FIRM|nr:pitrilysin family protein [Halanaerobium salsuginis]SFL06756.1 Predicted Zn-dependent peptidase [Halanaerobium salsuginis]